MKLEREKYTLTWHAYSDHLRVLMQDMMVSEDFADVTLVSDDKIKVKAHRNILSAFSSVFKEILQIETQNKHPMIYLRGIQYSEIESILQFMYLGEAKFNEERMNELLSAVRDLEIQELSKSVESNHATDKTAEKSEQYYTSSLTLEETDIVGSNDSMQQTVSTGNKYSCTQCDKHYTQQCHLTTHIKSVHDGVRYACSLCDFQATRQDGLTHHIQSKHEGVKYACNQCDKQYTQQRDVTRHIKSKHEGVKYTCNQCGKQYSEQNTLINHIQTIHEGLKYVCDQCDSQFTDKSNLTTHIHSKHDGIRYACNQCDYQSTDKGNLRKHIKAIHDGIKHACDQCDYQATQQSNLKKHIQSIHTAVKYENLTPQPQ